jgi:PAS domain S-box-containing protein
MNAHAVVSLTDEAGYITEVNDRFLGLTGWTREALIGRHAEVLYRPEDRPLQRQIQATLERGQTWSGETKIMHVDGSYIWTNATIIPRLNRKGKLTGAVAVRTDVSQARAAAADENTASILHRLWDEVYIFDAATLTFAYLNEAAMARTGWTLDVIGTKTLADLTPDFDLNRFAMLAKPLLDEEVMQVRRSVSFHGRPYDANLQLIRTPNKRDQFVCIMRDASERIENERQKAAFVATVSHELRSPLTSIKGAMGLVLSGAAGALPEKVKDMLEIAHRNADRLVLIINDILDLEKIDAGAMNFDLASRDITAIVDEAIRASEQFSSRFDVTVTAKGLDQPMFAVFDANRTMQVMTNLLSNAAKFSRPGGVIEVSLTSKDDIVRVEVRDHGRGIPADQQGKIFERFSQVSAPERQGVRGTGLGLSIVKAIIENQGGTVGFHSNENVGTTFFFELPQVSSKHQSTSSRKRA